MTMCVSERSLEILAQSKSYPARPDLASAFQAFGVTEYSVNDIATIINHLLSRLSKLEAHTGIDDISWTNVDCTPDISNTQRLDTFRDEVVRLMVILAVNLNHADHFRSNHILALDHVPSGQTDIAIKATVDLIEYKRVGSSLPLPITVMQTLRLVDNSASFIYALDEGELWENTRNVEELERLIRILWFKEMFRNGKAIQLKDAPKFKVAQGFLQSTVDCGFSRNCEKAQKLMAVFVDVLLKRNLQKAHAIREDRGGNSPAVKRGKDKGMRWDIDYEYHLHLWDTENGFPEFVSVVIHKDLSISEE